jgi:hypothetical protein
MNRRGNVRCANRQLSARLPDLQPFAAARFLNKSSEHARDYQSRDAPHANQFPAAADPEFKD